MVRSQILKVIRNILSEEKVFEVILASLWVYGKWNYGAFSVRLLTHKIAEEET